MTDRFVRNGYQSDMEVFKKVVKDIATAPLSGSEFLRRYKLLTGTQCPFEPTKLCQLLEEMEDDFLVEYYFQGEVVIRPINLPVTRDQKHRTRHLDDIQLTDHITEAKSKPENSASGSNIRLHREVSEGCSSSKDTIHEQLNEKCSGHQNGISTDYYETYLKWKDQRIQSPCSKSSQGPEQFDHEGPLENRKLVKVKENIISVLKKCPRGIPLSQLMQRYEDEIGEQLEMNELGFYVLADLLDSIQEVTCSRLTKGDLIVSLISAPCLHASTELSTVPSYRELDLNGILQSKLPRKICMEECVSPSEFCIRFLGDDTSEQLKILTKQMNIYFSENGEHLLETDIRVGMPCAANYSTDGDMHMHRAQIMEIIPGGDEPLVRIEYIDYGTVGYVCPLELNPLPEMFLELPKQSVTCVLDGVEPKNANDWCKESCELMWGLLNKELECMFTQCRKYYCVRLFYIESVNNYYRKISVNDELVQKGYAKWKDEQGATASNQTLQDFRNGSNSAIKHFNSTHYESNFKTYTRSFSSGHTIHILDYCDDKYILLEDLVLLFEDEIVEEVKGNYYNHAKIITKLFEPDLFDELAEHCMWEHEDERITLFPLTLLPNILITLRHASRTMIEESKTLITQETLRKP